jgi:hypothetical protein
MATITKSTHGSLDAFVGATSLFVSDSFHGDRLRVTIIRADSHIAQYLNREEAEALLARLGEKVAETSGAPPVYLIEEGDPQAAIRKAVGDDPDIKILILAAGANGRGPGPLVSAVLKQGAAFTGRKLPVTIVPGELTEAEILDLA